MKSTIEDLKKRRSIRAYKRQQIAEDELKQILEAGTYAPTGMNRQSPIIIAVQDPDTIKILSTLNARVMGKEDMDPFYGASTVVVVLADKSASTYREDGSLVLGNMMNAAYALGVGSCWIHRAKEVFESEEGKELLEKWGVFGNYVGIGHCILGYPEGDIPEAKERKENYIIRV